MERVCKVGENRSGSVWLRGTQKIKLLSLSRSKRAQLKTRKKEIKSECSEDEGKGSLINVDGD